MRQRVFRDASTVEDEYVRFRHAHNLRGRSSRQVSHSSFPKPLAALAEDGQCYPGIVVLSHTTRWSCYVISTDASAFLISDTSICSRGSSMCLSHPILLRCRNSVDTRCCQEEGGRSDECSKLSPFITYGLSAWIGSRTNHSSSSYKWHSGYGFCRGRSRYPRAGIAAVPLPR